MTPSSSQAHGSSGDILADRRFSYAEAMAREGDFTAAADLLDQVIALVPTWAPALLALGLALEQTGRREEATAAMARAVDLDREDGLGASLHLARLRDQHVPAMPPTYVATLFDQYAPRFDVHLTDTLGYQAPAILAECLERAVGRRRFSKVLDLGCGTGLMARALEGRTEAIDGVDLSPGMIEQARATGLYRNLTVADCAAFLTEQHRGAYDLILAADVFVYVGDLDSIMREMARVLDSGAAAFTVQTTDRDHAYRLGADLRFSHAPAYIHRVIAAAGLTAVIVESRSTRRERGVDVPGLVVVARAP